MDKDTLYAPDIVDFIIRKDAYYDQMILNHPGLIASYTVKGTYIICFARIKDYNEMTSYMGTDYINSIPTVLGLTIRPSLESSGIIQVQQQPYLNLDGTGVIIGFVDTGIDYTQSVFKHKDGSSKIRYIYDQTIPGTPPNGFPLGTEYSNEQINAALASDNPYEIVPHRDEVGHGTFLASVAAASPSEDVIGAAPNAEIIMVKLKKAYPFYLDRFMVPKEQENAFEASFLMLGVDYIAKKAIEMNRPAIICIGLGSDYDSHDGYSACEEYLYTIGSIPGICICTSAGNESQSKRHFYKRFSPDKGPVDIDVRAGEDAGDIFIVVSNKISDRTSVSLRSPTGELIERVPAKAAYSLTTRLVLERSEVNISYHFPIEGSGDQVTIVKIHDATPGIWTITVYGDIILDGTIQAWLPLMGFVSPSVEFLTSDPYYTITYPATGLGTIRCGATDSDSNILYPQSSWGPTRIDPIAPDLVAPGYQIGDIYPTGYGFMSGTSIATAITSGACALMMQWAIVNGHDLGFSTSSIKAYLIRGCNRSNEMNYPNSQWGFGSLNLLQSFYYMREISAR
ncbi:S8 family peptidase [Oscillospiraceae bacterium LTW-04]|nr:S8 family peptidase [Oscillospiraceae bacterium MB24-C1]